MEIIKPVDTTVQPPQGWVPFALGFRPFFLLAGIVAVLSIGVWPAVWGGRLQLPGYYDPIAWHAHEMLFGYGIAVVAGFLLTAVRNWTGLPTWSGARLAMLALVWLLARLLPWWPEVPAGLVLVVDCAFLPLLAISLARPLWQGQNRVNRVFIPLLLAMALINLLSHLQLLGVVTVLGDARRVMLSLILLLLVLVAGRVLPFFTQSVLPGFRARHRPRVEQAGFALLLAIVAAGLSPVAPGWLLALLWGGFGILQCIRLQGWFDRRALRIPVLWVLHAGYAWLCLGSLMTAAAALGLLPDASALHALTIGAVGVFTLGMMTRVARGHSGRPIDVSPIMVAAFAALNLAAAIRVLGPMFAATDYVIWIHLSTLSWVLAFVLFTWRYAPMLLRPRIDGRPG
jgi:uncharacterized protein involved in response to NO